MRNALIVLGVIDDADIEWLTAVGRKADLQAGDALLREGEPAEHVFLLLSGRLAVTTSATGDRAVSSLEPGEIVGELSFLDSRPPSATVSASEPSSALEIPRGELATKLEWDMAFASRFYRAIAMVLAQRLRLTTLKTGGGSGASEAEDALREIDPALLETLALAGRRFEYLTSQFGVN